MRTRSRGNRSNRARWCAALGACGALVCALHATGCGDDASDEGGTGGTAGAGGGGLGGDAGTMGGGGGASGGAAGGSAGSATGTGGSGGSATGTGGAPGGDVLKGYWVWEKRVMGTEVQPPKPLDAGQMKIAFGTGNNKCHYIWNETTGSDFHTECTYTVSGDLATYKATADSDGTAAGYSCAHPDWTSWNDRPALEWGRYKFVGDRLWLGVNAYWGGANGDNGSCKRFPFWESEGQAKKEEAWIVFKPVTRAEWYGKYAISTNCQGTSQVCAQWPGCGAGDKGYVG